MGIQDARRSALPPTLLADRFLAALVRLARRGQGSEPVALPVGVVDPCELACVIVALLRARADQRLGARL